MRNDLTSSTEYLVFARHSTSANPSLVGSSAGLRADPAVTEESPVISIRTMLIVMDGYENFPSPSLDE